MPRSQAVPSPLDLNRWPLRQAGSMASLPQKLEPMFWPVLQLDRTQSYNSDKTQVTSMRNQLVLHWMNQSWTAWTLYRAS